MSFNCRDCGEPITDENMTRYTGRTDVCDRCMKMREEIVAGKIVELGSKEFLIIQRKMRNGRGTVKKYIDKLNSKRSPTV